MVDIVDLQHALMLSNRLERFTVKSTAPYRINFRCFVCGDSQKSKIKARGWLIEDPKSHSFHYYCHNCGASLSFHNFLKNVDPLIYKDYIAAKYVEKCRPEVSCVPDDHVFEQTKTEIKFAINPLKKIKKISQLPHDHPAKKYVESRKIPSHQHFRIYYTPKFMSWINSVVPGKFADTTHDHPRLVFPFIGQDGVCFGVSARSFDPNGLRYITIMFEDRTKVFGLDIVDFSLPYFVVEGSIDSLFLPNTVAMAGADVNTECLKNIDNATFVFDLEYRNQEIIKRMEKIIQTGNKICIWPKDFKKYGKDINEMVLNGMTPNQIQDTIIKNTYRGIEASLLLSKNR